MEIEHVKDGGGNTLCLQKVDGRYFPTFPTDVIKNMTSLKIRHDDIILCGYMKAGTHWVWEIVRMLLKGSTNVENVEKDVAMMEQMGQKSIDALPSRRVLNSHVPFDLLPSEVHTMKPKIIYLTRNPKDTVVAMYHHHIKLGDYYHYKGTFKDYFPLFLDGKLDYGSWFSHIKSWSEGQQTCMHQSNIPFMDVNYEDLLDNPSEMITKIAIFIGVNVTDDLISDIESECHITRMRERKGKFDLDAQGQSIMYRKGQPGDWRNWFTVAQNEQFDQVYHDKMATIDTRFHWRF